MQIPKISLLICALALGAAVTIRAEDTPAQAAARAVLEAKLKELNSQPASAPASNDVVMKPVSSETAPVDQAKVKADKAAAKLKAKQAADQAAAELKAKKESEEQVARQHKALAAQQKKAAADQAAAEAKAKQAADKQAAQQKEAAIQAVVLVPAEKTVPSVPEETDTAAQAAARAALLKQLGTPPPTTQASVAPVEKTVQPKPQPKAQPVPAVQPVVAQPSQPAPVEVKNYPGKELGLKPIVAPVLPIAATKEEKLQALLAKYKADQLSPEEYHQQRAAILAEP